MTNLIEESVDLIVTSPPYNVDIHYNSFQDDIPYEKYLEFTEKWLRKAYSLMKPDGRMCLNIPLDKSKESTMRSTRQKICCADTHYSCLTFNNLHHSFTGTINYDI